MPNFSLPGQVFLAAAQSSLQTPFHLYDERGHPPHRARA